MSCKVCRRDVQYIDPRDGQGYCLTHSPAAPPPVKRVPKFPKKKRSYKKKSDNG